MTRSLTRIVAVMVAVTLGACVDDLSRSPLAPEHAVSLAATEQPFYYYMGFPIPLEIDPSGLTVAGETDAALEEVAAALRRDGFSISATYLLDHLPGQGVVRFSDALPPQALDRAISAVRSRPDVTFAAPLYRNPEGAQVRLWNRLIVEFDSGVPAAEAESTLKTYGARILRSPEPDSARFSYWAAYPRGADPLQFAARLYEDPLVRFTEPDRTSDSTGPLALPSEPYVGLQWHIKNTRMLNGVYVDDHVEPVWDAGNRGGGLPSAGGLRIAVIDDGVDADHPDLEVQTWSAYDVFGRQASGCTDCATSPRGNDTHGTAVAGIAAAEHNGIGVAGIAPDAQLVAIRIYRCSYAPPCADDRGTPAEVADAIDWAWYVAAADVLSNSWRWDYSDAIRAAIVRALTDGRDGLGSVVVFAAGNTSRRSLGQFGGVTFPGSLAATTNVTSVSAINRYGNPTDYAPQGGTNEISVVAMSGHNTGACLGEVVTTDLAGSSGCNDGPTNDYTDTFSGTSAATPQVSGIAALVLTADFGLTAGEVKSRIRASAVPWGRSDWYGSGKVDAAAAVGYQPPPPPPLSVSITGPEFVPRYTECVWEASVSGGTSPYSYKWYRNGSLVSATPFYLGSTGDSSFSLDLTVTDGAGASDSDGLWIQVESGAPECDL